MTLKRPRGLSDDALSFADAFAAANALKISPEDAAVRRLAARRGLSVPEFLARYPRPVDLPALRKRHGIWAGGRLPR